MRRRRGASTFHLPPPTSSALPSAPSKYRSLTALDSGARALAVPTVGRPRGSRSPSDPRVEEAGFHVR